MTGIPPTGGTAAAPVPAAAAAASPIAMARAVKQAGEGPSQPTAVYGLAVEALDVLELERRDGQVADGERGCHGGRNAGASNSHGGQEGAERTRGL